MKLIILSAGNNSRFKAGPKGLAIINGKSNIQNTIDKAKGVFDEIVVVANHMTLAAHEHELSGCSIIAISSGKGEAHAVYRTLEELELTESNEKIAFCWNDTYIPHNGIFLELIKNQNLSESMIFPVSYRENPVSYCDINKNFEVTGYYTSEQKSSRLGFQDQSVFCFKPELIYTVLREKMIASEVMKTIQEVSFLNIIETLYNSIPAIAYITKFPTLNYDTVEEVGQIEQLLYYRK